MNQKKEFDYNKQGVGGFKNVVYFPAGILQEEEIDNTADLTLLTTIASFSLTSRQVFLKMQSNFLYLVH